MQLSHIETRMRIKRVEKIYTFDAEANISLLHRVVALNAQREIKQQ